MGCYWITDIAQVKKDIPEGNYLLRHKHTFWKGSIAEYNASLKRWEYLCPVWHTGQALKALCLAYPFLKEEKLLIGANLCAEFIAKNRIRDKNDDDYGLILAYEDEPDMVGTSAILESLDGLLHFAELTGEKIWNEMVIDAVRWVVKKAYIGGGIFYDVYDPKEKRVVPYKYSKEYEGRPLLDDGIFYKVYKLTNDVKLLEIFLETADRLLKDEDPPGNWIMYGPCNKHRGNIHPRHAYWWGYPMYYAYEETKENKYLECLVRAGEWYARAQRRDGGLFRATFTDFSTTSFGHASSGIACAMIIWLEIEEITGMGKYNKNIDLALEYLLKMQFLNPNDPNLKGAILEKVLEPDGTDKLPYYVRDLGTIFFIQALTKYLKNN